MNAVMKVIRHTVSRSREALGPQAASTPSRLHLWISGKPAHEGDAAPTESAPAEPMPAEPALTVAPVARQFNFATSSLLPLESTLLREVVAGTSSLAGPIVEVGTLIGLTTTQMAIADWGQRNIITVDNYCWNPWGLSVEEHRDLAAKLLSYLSATGRVQIVDQDKNEFFISYRGPAPSLVFLDAIHDYPETRKDIVWAKAIGASVIAGHDYTEAFPGVIQAVDEAGGARRLVGSLWVL